MLSKCDFKKDVAVHFYWQARSVTLNALRLPINVLSLKGTYALFIK